MEIVYSHEVGATGLLPRDERAITRAEGDKGDFEFRRMSAIEVFDRLVAGMVVAFNEGMIKAPMTCLRPPSPCISHNAVHTLAGIATANLTDPELLCIHSWVAVPSRRS